MTLKASSRFQLPYLASRILMSGWPFITPLKASKRSLSRVVGIPRSTTILPLPFRLLARYSAGSLPKAVLSPAIYASCASVLVKPRSTTVTYTPLFLTCATGCVRDADPIGKITRVLILLTVNISCNWLACSGAVAAVLTMIFKPGWAFSSSALAWLAHQTMPEVKLWVAVGIATPTTNLSAGSAACAFGKAHACITSTAIPATRIKLFMLLSSKVVGARWLPFQKTAVFLFAAPLQEGDGDDHHTLHCGIQVDTDDAGQIQDIADHGEQDGADHGADDASLAPFQGRATHHHGSDRFQFPQQARGRRGRAQARHIQHGGNAHAHAQQHISENFYAVDIDRGIARNLLVGTNRLHMAAKGGAIQDDGAGCRDEQKDPDRYRCAQHAGVIHGAVQVRQGSVQGQRAAIGQIRQHGAEDAQGTQSHDKWFDIAFADQQAMH